MIRVKEDYDMRELQVFVNGLKQGIIKMAAGANWVFFDRTRGKSIEYKNYFSLKNAIERSTIKFEI